MKLGKNAAGKLVAFDDAGKEIAIENPDIFMSTAPAAPSETDIQMKVDAAKREARAEAIKEEREYRAKFETVMSTNKIDGELAVDFRREWEGVDIVMVEKAAKGMAKLAIQKRANPIGEGAPSPAEGEHGTQAGESPAEVRMSLVKRIKTDKRFAQMIARVPVDRSGNIDESNPHTKARIDYLAEIEMRMITDFHDCRRNTTAKTLAASMQSVNKFEGDGDDDIARIIMRCGSPETAPASLPN
jgi:hypothetical protein